MRRLSRCLAAGVLAICLTSCGGSGLSSVSGVVLMDGQPYGGVDIIFHPESGGGANATAVADIDTGKFRMGTFEPGDGVKPGTYKVTVTSHNYESKPAEHPSAAFAKMAEQKGGAKIDGNKEYAKMQAAAAKAAKRAATPEVYATVATTPLTVTVPASGEVKLEMTGKK